MVEVCAVCSMPRDNRCMYMAHVCFMSFVVTGSGVNRVQVVLSGLSVRLFCLDLV